MSVKRSRGPTATGSGTTQPAPRKAGRSRKASKSAAAGTQDGTATEAPSPNDGAALDAQATDLLAPKMVPKRGIEAPHAGGPLPASPPAPTPATQTRQSGVTVAPQINAHAFFMPHGEAPLPASLKDVRNTAPGLVAMGEKLRLVTSLGRGLGGQKPAALRANAARRAAQAFVDQDDLDS